MNAFVDFDFYINNYGGAAIPATDFLKLANMASFEVNTRTLERAEKVLTEGTDTSLMNKIKMATCAVIDVMYEGEQHSGHVASEKIGDHAVTYANADVVAGYETAKLHDAIYRYLGLTGLMFAGVG